MLIWFHYVDVYHRHFAATGSLVAVQNFLRVVFIFYLFWIVQAVGAAFLRLVARREFDAVGLPAKLALGFFAGTGPWHVAMLALGYLNLYSFAVATIVTLPVVLVAYGNFAHAVREIRAAAGSGRLRRNLGAGTSALVGWTIVTFAGVAFILLLLIKGLYPGGGHDYFTHYFYYYVAVLERGGLWPNDVWYHYYYSKGAGLYFLAMLLTDPLAPQLVTFCFMAAAALVIFLASRDSAPATRWPWVAVLLFFIIFLHTPFWGEFEKLHGLTTALVIAAVWTAAGAFERCGHSPNALWPAATAATIAAAVIVNPTIAVFLGATFGILSVWYFLSGQSRAAHLSFLFAAVNGLLLAGILLINYATTGLLSDQVLLSTWSHANLEKLDQWGAVAVVIKQYWGLVGMVAERLPLSQVPKLLIQSSRLDLIYPLSGTAAAVGIAAVAFRLRNGRWAGPVHVPHQAGILLATIPVFLAIALTAGRVQPVSFYRYTAFAVPLMLVGAVGLWGMPVSSAGSRFARLVLSWRMPAAVCALSFLTFVAATPPARFFDTVLPRALRFAAGAISIDTAYTLQPSTPHFIISAIHPGARGAYAVVGPATPIWSFHVLTYCMLPDCRIEAMGSFILPDWDKVMFGDPEEGRRAMQASRHNYFLFSRELPLTDSLPLSPVFSPANIARYLGIRWTDGTTSLLTWLGPGIQPLDQTWLADYRRAVENSGTVLSFPYHDMKQIFERLNATPKPWRSFPLPW